MSPGEVAAERLRDLAIGLGDTECARPKRGWQAAVARRLGITPGYLSKILNGERTSVGMDVVETVSQAVPIQRAYFSSGVPGQSLEWRDYLATPGEDSPPRGSSYFQAARGWAALFLDAVHKGTPSIRYAQGAADSVLTTPLVQAARDFDAADNEQDRWSAGYRLVALLTSLDAAPPPPPPGMLRVRHGGKKAIPRQGAARGEYVALRAVGEGTPATDNVIEVAGALYVASEDLVPDSPYYRRAIEHGDLIVIDN